MAKGQGKRIDDATRAQVIAALLAGQGVMEVAAAYKIPQSSVSRFKKLIPKQQLDEVGCKKGENIAYLISKNLEESFQAISNIQKITENNEWLVKQPAAELATFVGVTADKVFRVLEAIENANAGSEEAE